MQEEISRRIADLTNWLKENHPEVAAEQRHLDARTPERAYWHFGYLMALKDVQNKQLS